ncbi:hypothetical protein MTO96_007921 [Rhipicephalus appendiculatus]
MRAAAAGFAGAGPVCGDPTKIRRREETKIEIETPVAVTQNSPSPRTVSGQKQGRGKYNDVWRSSVWLEDFDRSLFKHDDLIARNREFTRPCHS